MATIENIDFVNYAKDILPAQYYDKENINTILKAFASQYQIVEDDVFNINESFSLENATGVFLDLLGSIVGEGRQGRSDEPYRDAIKLKVLFNSSSGTPNEILIALKDITNANNVDVWEHFPVASFFYTDGTDIPDRLAGSIGDSLPATSGECVVMLDENNDVFYGSELEQNLYNLVDQDGNQFVDELNNDFVATAGEFFSVLDSERNFLSEYTYQTGETGDGLGYLPEVVTEEFDSYTYDLSVLGILTSTDRWYRTMNFIVPDNFQ